MKVLAFLSLLGAALPAGAVSIAVPNGSFESPNVTGVSPYYVQFPNDVAGVSGAWERYAATFNAVYEAGRYGVSPSGLDGTQAATLSAAIGGGIFQETAPYDGSGNADLYWQEGTYTMTVGVFLRSDNLPRTGSNPVATLALRMFFRTADQGAANLLAETLVARGTDPLSSSEITDYLVTYTVAAGSPEIGKPIGLWFAPTAGNAGDWGVDHVRLDFAAVPEPSVVLLGGLGLLGLMRRRR